MAILAGALLGGRRRVRLPTALPALECGTGLLEDLLPAADALKILLQDFRGVLTGEKEEKKISGIGA